MRTKIRFCLFQPSYVTQKILRVSEFCDRLQKQSVFHVLLSVRINTPVTLIMFRDVDV